MIPYTEYVPEAAMPSTKTIYKYLISELDKLNTNYLLKLSISSLDTFYTNKNRRFREVGLHTRFQVIQSLTQYYCAF